MGRGSNLLRLADFNQAVVLDAVRRSPGISRAELGRESGLSSQTISNIARRLIDDELIREGEPVETPRGRPRIPLLIDRSGSFAVGVHVDPARLTIVLLDLAGEVRCQAHIPTPQAHRPEQVVTAIAATADCLVAEAGIDRGRLLGLGIAAPGPVDVVAGVVVDPPQLKNWHTVRLRADLHDLTGLPVLLDKDVTAAVTAELRSSTDSSADFAFLYLGSGVGAGIVMDGQVLRGVTNNIGEVGDILVDPDAEDLRWSGRRGGLAAACVPEALVIQSAAAGLLRLPDLTDYVAVDDAFTELCALADQGNERALAVVDRSARRVAVGLGVIVNLLNVERVVLGGPLWSRLSARYLALLPDLVTAEAVAARGPIRVEGSRVGDQIAAQGAAELVMAHFLGPRPSVLLME